MTTTRQVTLGYEFVRNIPPVDVNENTTQKTSGFWRKSEYLDCNEFIENECVMRKFEMAVTANNTMNNSTTHTEAITSKRYKNIKKGKISHYIELVEGGKVDGILNKLPKIMVAIIYCDNLLNINKLENGKKCILNYKQSCFATKTHLPLFYNLDKKLKKYISEHKIFTDDFATIFQYKPKPMKEIFTKATVGVPPSR